MLINLGNTFTLQAIQALIALSKQESLPPILVLDRLNQDNVKPQFDRLRQQVEPSSSYLSEQISTASVDLESILSAIATQISPPSLSMAELLNYIHEALIAKE